MAAGEENFIRERFGWVCRRCRDAEAGDTRKEAEKCVRASRQEGRARFFHEGEGGDRTARLSTRALARWREGAEGKLLFCPSCGAEGPV